jgi:hypothetical protein
LSDTTPYDDVPEPPQPPAPPPLPPPPTAQADEGWYEEPDELPARPRARFLTPLTVVLMLVLFAACGFVGGVLVQKGQQSGATSTIGAAASSRLGAAASGATGSGGAFAGRGGLASRFAAAFGGAVGGGEAIGTVTDISGNKLYVTSAAGTMTEVITTPQSKITKSQPVGRSAIHPGDTVVASGVTGNTGALTASTITDSGSSGTSSSSGASSLFGGGTSTGASSTTGSASLFGG